MQSLPIKWSTLSGVLRKKRALKLLLEEDMLMP
jgi:hypothetical protein